MKKKLLLINPSEGRKIGGLNVSHATKFEPLGLGIIAALTPSNWDIDLIDENFTEHEFQNADLVAISSFTNNINRAYEIIKIYRQKGIHTVLGGIHASLVTEEATKYVDTIVVGEAEEVWHEVIKDFENGCIKQKYGPKLADITKIPKVRREIFKYKYQAGSIQTARGCPMNCNFCSVSVFNGTKHRYRPIDEVLDELETIPQKYVFFVDDNLISNTKESRERALALFKGIIKRNIKKKWACQTSISVAEDEDILKTAYQSGCRLMLIGIESESLESLETINKNLNMKELKNYKKIFSTIHKYRIAILGAFIFGLDTDNAESLKKRMDFINNSGVDVVQVTILTPLPGTRLFQNLQKENRLILNHYPEDWIKYDFLNTVFKPKYLEKNELTEIMKNINKNVFSYRNIFKRVFKNLKATKRIFTAFWVLKYNLVYRKATLKCSKNDFSL